MHWANLGIFMRHYELVLLIHPDYTDQVKLIIDKYKSLVSDNGGIIHRCEDCGRRPLAYAISKLTRAHYVLMNIEGGNDMLTTLKDTLKYHEVVVRSLVVQKDKADIAPSVWQRSLQS